jgi:hypothetical protein
MFDLLEDEEEGRDLEEAFLFLKTEKTPEEDFLDVALVVGGLEWDESS